MEADEILTLFFRERPSLEAFLFGATRDYQGTQDILQDTALAVTRKCRAYDPALPFRPWVNGFVRRELASWLKARGARARSLEAEALEACAPMFEQVMKEDLLRSRRDAMQECLRSVPPSGRQMLDMRYVQRQSCEEIAPVLGRSVQGVYALLKRLKASLKVCVEGRLKEALS